MTHDEFRKHLSDSLAAGNIFATVRACILAHRRQHDDKEAADEVDECERFCASIGQLGIYNAAWTSVTAELEDRAAVNAMPPSWERKGGSE